MMAGRPLGADGLLVLTEQQEEFLEWLVTPSRERAGSQNDLARKLGVSPSTLTRWKNDQSFRRRLDARLAELNVEPDRIQRIVEAMYQQAIQGDVKAMQLYLQYVDRFTPKTALVVEDRTVQSMSDAELAAELAATAKALAPGVVIDADAVEA